MARIWPNKPLCKDSPNGFRSPAQDAGERADVIEREVKVVILYKMGKALAGLLGASQERKL